MTLYRLENLLENAEALGIRTMGELQDFYTKNKKDGETAELTLLRVVFAKAVGKWEN